MTGFQMFVVVYIRKVALLGRWHTQMHCRVYQRGNASKCRYSGHFVQDAQLSQRDCAAGCVIVLAKSGRQELGHKIFYAHYRSIFNHCDIIGLKICRIR